MPLKETPTMASGDHIWTIPELIEVSAKLCHLGLKPNGPGDMLGFVRLRDIPSASVNHGRRLQIHEAILPRMATEARRGDSGSFMCVVRRLGEES